MKRLLEGEGVVDGTTGKMKAWTPNRSDNGATAVDDAHDLHIEGRILYKDHNYLVIDKPYDVRMNGEFPVTVEKLVKKAFVELTDCNLKWIHQLDYATSGVLW
jgi:23S rRNA-/tRNA-specific pseudouridylate synthase